MSAKEKAKELVDKFQQEYLIVVEMTERKMYNHEAKQCALIAVDEILKTSASEHQHEFRF